MRVLMLMSVLGLSGGMLTLGGCERELSHSEKTTVDDSGKVKKESTTVTEQPDGSVQKRTEKETNRP